MSEKNTNVTETVEIDQAMGVMPEEVDPGMSVMPGPGVADTPTVIPELDSMFAVALDQLPAYTTTDWKNKPSTATPVTAEIMKKIEQRLVDLTNAYNNQEAEIKTLRGSVSRTARRVHTGTKVIDSVGSGETDVTLFTNEQFSSIVGRPFDQASDFVMAMSGEKDSIDRFPISVSYLKRDKSLIARISSGSANMIRVNYLIVIGA